MLISTRGGAGDEQPVFPSRRGGHLHTSQLLRIVQKAAKRVGIEKRVSPHWFRHSHASHALDNGAPIHLVQTTLEMGEPEADIAPRLSTAAVRQSHAWLRACGPP